MRNEISAGLSIREAKVQNKMQKLIFIGLAGFAGTLMRYSLSEWTAKRFGETFPTGTLVVNLLGCFLAGLLFYLMFDRYLINPTVRTVVLIGLLGGFTTFSSFGLQTFTLLRDGEIGLALLNIAISNIAGLLMVWVGYSLAKVF
jgi:fluoride exporter